MKSYTIHITETARRDVVNAVAYIDKVLKNPIAADDLLDAFENNVRELSTFPERFPIAQDPMLTSWGIRFLNVKNYLAFYLVDDKASTVYIVRFLYASSNWICLLKEGFSIL